MLVQPDGTDGARGTAFSRVSAFRTGYFKDANSCIAAARSVTAEARARAGYAHAPV